MTIYALFFCMQVTGACRMVGDSRITFAGQTVEQTYDTLADCQKIAGQMSQKAKPDPHGRYRVPGNMWYECRSKHVDTWESTSQ